jgi:predicted permease
MPDFIGYVRRNLPRPDGAANRYDEMVDEIASELEARYVLLRQRGASADQAWSEVVAQVPSWSTLARDLTTAGAEARVARRASRWRAWMSLDGWTREIVPAVRVLIKERGFTATAIVTLAVCLGGHAAIAAAVNAMLFHPLNTPEPDRIFLMANQYPRAEATRGLLSATPDYEDRLRYVTAFEEQALYNGTAATIAVAGIATQMRGMSATPSLFRLLRVTPVLGRTFTDDEATPGNDARVLLTDGLWRELFGRDPSAVGRTLRLTGREYTIVGVLPADFRYGDPTARFWTPLALTAEQKSDDARHRNGWVSIGRLKPGATIEQVKDQLELLDAANLARMPPRMQSILTGTGFYTGVEPIEDVLVRDVRGPLELLWIAALVVLVIGVVNLCTIALARSRGRLTDFGTRLALGATRLDILRQLLVEGLLIAAGGAAGGVAVGAWLLALLRAAQPGMAHLSIDATTVGITLGIAALVGVLTGLVSTSPIYTAPLGTMLHEAMRGGTRSRAVRVTWRTLIVAQMACSFMLLAGSAALWTSVRNLLAVDLGFRSDDVLTATITLPPGRYTADGDARAFAARSLDAIRQVPGVAVAGATTIVPLGGNMQSTVVVAEGYVPAPGEPAVSGVRSIVSAGYFEAIGTPLVQGRYFDERDEQPRSRTIVIDERLAKRFWPGGDAVGRRLFCPTNANQLASIDANTPWLTIVGVVRNARLQAPNVEENLSGTTGTYYLSYGVVVPRFFGYVIRTRVEPADVVRDVRAAMARVDPEVPMFDIRTIPERMQLRLAPRTNTMHLAMAFAGVGVFLSAIGLYGMLAFSVTQRRREIGVRLAVGSAPAGIVALVLREGVWLSLAGAVLGAAGSLAFGRVMTAQLYGTTASNPWMMLTIAVALGAVGALACAVPANRAARVDVMRILSSP